MLDKQRWIGYFQRFLDDGYVEVFIDDAMFLYTAKRAVVIKIQLFPVEQKLRAGIIQFDVDDYSSEKVLASLTDFPFDLEELEDSHFYTIDIGDISDIGGEQRAISKLIDNLLFYDKYRIFGVSLRSIVEDKLAELINVNGFDVIAKKAGSMVERVYLWNSYSGIMITRNYYDWHINSSIYQFTKRDTILNITKIAALWEVFDNCPKDLGWSNTVYDWEQDDYFEKLMKMIDSQQLSLSELIKKPSIDWYELTKPESIDPEASWTQIDTEG